MFLGINHSMVDSFDQNSNPSLDLLKNDIIQWEGAPSRSIFFSSRDSVGPRHAPFFFVKRSVSQSSSSWQLGIGCIGFCTDPRCICGSSLVMICQGVRELWWKKTQTDRQTDAPRPSKTGPETGHFRVLFANEILGWNTVKLFTEGMQDSPFTGVLYWKLPIDTAFIHFICQFHQSVA